ncbi:MAG: Gfo/Idh/MocA family oxidoreductase [Candidatus Bathyarchaeia archaeon]
MMSRLLNVGVVGVGTIGVDHLKTYMACRKARVVAIADIKEDLVKSVASKYGIKRFFTDYRDLVALKDVDAVSVCTPPFAHASITCDSAAAGKHVLCEKPMAMNAEEAKRMVEVCKGAGVKLGICHSRVRFNLAAEMARKYLSSGKLGTVYYARYSRFRRRGRPGLDILESSKWFLDSSKAGGGALADIGCYDIDLILYLLGSPQPWAVSAMTFRGVGTPPKLTTPYDVEEHASLFVRFRDGPVVTFETAWASNMDHGEGVVLFGTRGGLKLNPFTFYTEQGGKQVAISLEISGKPPGDFINDFVTACLKDRAPKTPGEDGLKVMQIISMAYASAKLGREVTLTELEKFHEKGAT